MCELREAERRIRELEIKDGSLEKSRGPYRQRAKVVDRCRLMLAEKAEYPVKMVARLPEVSRPGFCPWPAAGAPTDGWGRLRDAGKRVWLEGGRRHEAHGARVPAARA